MFKNGKHPLAGKQVVIEAAGRASVGNLGTTPKIIEVKNNVGIHSVSCDTVVYVPGRVGGHPVDMLVDIPVQR